MIDRFAFAEIDKLRDQWKKLLAARAHLLSQQLIAVTDNTDLENRRPRIFVQELSERNNQFIADEADAQLAKINSKLKSLGFDITDDV